MTHRFPFIGFLSVAFVVSGTLAAERARPAGPRTEGRAAAAFRKLDRDGDGRLSFSEWHRTRRGAEAMPSKALELFRTSDLNRNLRLSPYEFARSLGIRITAVTSNSTQGNVVEGSRGAAITISSARGSNGTLGLTGGSSITVTGSTLQFGSSAGGSRSSVDRLAGGSFSVTDLTNSNSLGLLTNLTGGSTQSPITIYSGSSTINSGSTPLGSGSLTLTGGSTIPGSTLIIRDTFSRYIGLTLEAARQLAETERRASRVINIDGEQQVVTMDWSPTRVNFFLVDGVVTVAIGG